MLTPGGAVGLHRGWPQDFGTAALGVRNICAVNCLAEPPAGNRLLEPPAGNRLAEPSPETASQNRLPEPPQIVSHNRFPESPPSRNDPNWRPR